MKTQKLNILEMSKEEIIAIDPNDVEQELSKIEFFHILKELEGYLEFDHSSLESGNPGDHFELKSGLHSDSFMDFSAILQHENLRKIVAKQLVNKYKSSDRVTSNLDWENPTCVAGIPNGATLLGEEVAGILGARKIELVKQDGNIIMNSVLKLHDTLLFVDDVFTGGTASKKAIATIVKYGGSGRILPFVLAIANRGGLNQIRVIGGFIFNIISLFSVKFNEWDKDDCELCNNGSKRIKPKETEENWQLITTSQL